MSTRRKLWTTEDLAPYLGTYDVRFRSYSGAWVISHQITLILPRNDEEWARPWNGMIMLLPDGREATMTPGNVRACLHEGSLVRHA